MGSNRPLHTQYESPSVSDASQRLADPHFLRQQLYALALAEIRTNGPFSLQGPVEELTSDDITGEKLLRFEGFVFCASFRFLFF